MIMKMLFDTFLMTSTSKTKSLNLKLTYFYIQSLLNLSKNMTLSKSFWQYY